MSALIMALEFAAQAIPRAVEAYKAIRGAVLAAHPNASESVAVLDEMVAKALEDLPAIHAAQAAELLKR